MATEDALRKFKLFKNFSEYLGKFNKYERYATGKGACVTVDNKNYPNEAIELKLMKQYFAAAIDKSLNVHSGDDEYEMKKHEILENVKKFFAELSYDNVKDEQQNLCYYDEKFKRFYPSALTKFYELIEKALDNKDFSNIMNNFLEAAE